MLVLGILALGTLLATPATRRVAPLTTGAC